MHKNRTQIEKEWIYVLMVQIFFFSCLLLLSLSTCSLDLRFNPISKTSKHTA